MTTSPALSPTRAGDQVVRDVPAMPDVHVGRGMLLPLDEVLRRMRLLSRLEREVLVLRMGRTAEVSRSVDQTAAALRLTRRRVIAIESLAWAKLRHPSTTVT